MKTLDNLKRDTVEEFTNEDTNRYLHHDVLITKVIDHLHDHGRIVPDGYVAVPWEPTEKMVEAGELTDELYHSVAGVVDVYKAMIAAAQKGDE